MNYKLQNIWQVIKKNTSIKALLKMKGFYFPEQNQPGGLQQLLMIHILC